MLHPSYTELMDTINKRAEEEGNPIVTSRYSIVIASAKRARQLIAESCAAADDETVSTGKIKPLSQAVEELMNGDVKIVEHDSFEEEEEFYDSSVYDVSLEGEEGGDYEDGEYDEEYSEEDEDAPDDAEDEEDED